MLSRSPNRKNSSPLTLKREESVCSDNKKCVSRKVYASALCQHPKIKHVVQRLKFDSNRDISALLRHISIDDEFAHLAKSESDPGVQARQLLEEVYACLHC